MSCLLVSPGVNGRWCHVFASDILKVISVKTQTSNFSFYAASYLSSSEVSRDVTLFFYFCLPISITFLLEFFCSHVAASTWMCW